MVSSDRARALQRRIDPPIVMGIIDLPTTDDDLRRAIGAIVPPHRLIADPLRRLAYGTDASFYRLIPRLVVVVEREAEVVELLALCRRLEVPVTFRAAGTSLSGQAVTDSVLVSLGDGWKRCDIGPGADTVRLQPGVIGGVANRRLAPFGRKIGPDPASIDAAMIGGIAANNASGMCCGTAQNSYRTLAAMRVVLADGGVLDTSDPSSVAAFRISHADLLSTLGALAHETKGNTALADRIRHKFRIKNTTGYSLNALVDYDDPVDILIHLMIGSEGTLGFISDITYRTVPEHPCKASALAVFDDLESACTAVTLLSTAPVSAVELMDRAALRSVEQKPGMPDNIRELGPDGAALLIETRAETAAELDRQIASIIGAACRDSDLRAAALLDRSRRMPPVLEHPQGDVPFRRRDARRRHHRGDRGRRLSRRTARRRDAGPAGAAARARLCERDHLRARARRQSAFRVHAGLQHARRK